MSKSNVVDLVKMKNGSSGKVVSLEGGSDLALRLQNLGIRQGQKLTKLSSHFWRGPVTVQVGRAKIALGHGMAQKVKVEVVEK